MICLQCMCVLQLFQGQEMLDVMQLMMLCCLHDVKRKIVIIIIGRPIRVYSIMNGTVVMHTILKVGGKF